MEWARRLRSAIRSLARLSIFKPISRAILRVFRGDIRDYDESRTVKALRPKQPVLSGPDSGNEIGTQLAHELLLHAADNIPPSNGCRYFEPIPLRVAIVTDIYMFNFYRDCFRECIYVSPDNVDEVIQNGFDVLLYVTCWAGINDDEWRGIKYRERPKEALEQLISHCDANGIPKLFQSIEDPSNFEHFLPIAQRCTHVFTSDSGSLGRYREALGHDRVHYGEYGVNPLVCNPIGSARPALNAAFFAGSFPARYPERCEDMEVVFSSIVKSGVRLVIADRNFGTTDEKIRFPEVYQRMIVDKFDHEVLQRIHKLFRYNLNFNSIKDSPTMCAMRVYELQALGRGILSNYARSVFNSFPRIKLLPEPQQVGAYFGGDTAHFWREYKRNSDGILDVMTAKTSFDVARGMMEAAGLCEPAPVPGVAVIVRKITPAIQRMFDRQDYPRKHLLVEIDILDEKRWSALRKQHGIAYMAYFSAKADYGARYLDSLINAFKYTCCRYVTKGACFEDGRFVTGVQHDYTEILNGRARSAFCADSFSPSQLKALPDLGRTLLADGYSVDPFELNEDAFFRSLRGEVRDQYALSVIVPVYNNGPFLAAKCMESLQRSACWPELEVILVDDGSTDGSTPRICEELARHHANVRVFRFEEGGSGSASRPRNKGIELATAPFVSFLDPDNEISVGGYDVLLSIHREQEEEGLPVDFVSGYQVKVGRVNTRTGVHSVQRSSVLERPRTRYLEEGRFPVVSTQAAVIRRQFLLDNQLRFVEGAAGQDTLFGWQVLAAAGRVAFTRNAFILYYHERQQSITNHVDARYFDKMLVLEREQLRWLEQEGLRDIYVDHHLDGYVRNWYLKQLERTPGSDLVKARQTLRSIVTLYGVSPEIYGL
jgi:glycosyltransferase involved in cell wall biosynthesis